MMSSIPFFLVCIALYSISPGDSSLLEGSQNPAPWSSLMLHMDTWQTMGIMLISASIFIIPLIMFLVRAYPSKKRVEEITTTTQTSENVHTPKKSFTKRRKVKRRKKGKNKSQANVKQNGVRSRRSSSGSVSTRSASSTDLPQGIVFVDKPNPSSPVVFDNLDAHALRKSPGSKLTSKTELAQSQPEFELSSRSRHLEELIPKLCDKKEQDLIGNVKEKQEQRSKGYGKDHQEQNSTENVEEREDQILIGHVKEQREQGLFANVKETEDQRSIGNLKEQREQGSVANVKETEDQRSIGNVKEKRGQRSIGNVKEKREQGSFANVKEQQEQGSIRNVKVHQKEESLRYLGRKERGSIETMKGRKDVSSGNVKKLNIKDRDTGNQGKSSVAKVKEASSKQLKSFNFDTVKRSEQHYERNGFNSEPNVPLRNTKQPHSTTSTNDLNRVEKIPASVTMQKCGRGTHFSREVLKNTPVRKQWSAQNFQNDSETKRMGIQSTPQKLSMYDENNAKSHGKKQRWGNGTMANGWKKQEQKLAKQKPSNTTNWRDTRSSTIMNRNQSEFRSSFFDSTSTSRDPRARENGRTKFEPFAFSTVQGSLPTNGSGLHVDRMDPSVQQDQPHSRGNRRQLGYSGYLPQSLQSEGGSNSSQSFTFSSTRSRSVNVSKPISKNDDSEGNWATYPNVQMPFEQESRKRSPIALPTMSGLDNLSIQRTVSPFAHQSAPAAASLASTFRRSNTVPRTNYDRRWYQGSSSGGLPRANGFETDTAFASSTYQSFIDGPTSFRTTRHEHSFEKLSSNHRQGVTSEGWAFKSEQPAREQEPLEDEYAHAESLLRCLSLIDMKAQEQL